MKLLIIFKDETKYEIDQSNNQYWLIKGPWYNTFISSRFHGSLFEDFIIYAITDRYNFRCYLFAHKKPAYEDEEISLGVGLIPKNETIEALEALGDTLNFIDIWLKLSEKNYEIRYEVYNKAMKGRLKQVTLTMIKSLSLKQKFHKLMTEIGDGG